MVQNLLDMGQNSSLPRGRRKSLRSSLRRRSVQSKHSLSHTFTINDNDDRIEQLNINIASEEELMTLPGVNREIARSIVEHRKAIGRFRKTEDLALVRGIGADKLQLIRPEICVSSRKNHSCASSRAPSYDSLRSTDSRLTVKSNKLINVNKATVFELQTVHGITQEIAAAIVHYRNKKGSFRQVEDLIKVKNIDRMRLHNISRFLTVENHENDAFETEESRPSILTNGYTMPYQNGRCNSVPLKLPVTNGLTHSSTFDIFELLSAYSPRPVLQEDFRYSRNGEPAIRMASWNMHEFSFEKANNLGVKEVICRTILENGWSIVAVQDVMNVTALRTICEELNKPRLQRVKEWKDRNHNWNFCMLDVHDSKLGFIYDSDGAADIDLISLNEGPEETKDDCEVLVATFRVGELNLQLVNLMLSKDADVKALNRKIAELVGDGESDMLLVFVDLSLIDEPEGFLSVGNLKPVFSPSTNTNFIYPKLPTSIHNTTNILHNGKLQQQLTGTKGIVRHGLTHLAIPNGWTWGGPVSPFCPVWVELFLGSTLGTAL